MRKAIALVWFFLSGVCLAFTLDEIKELKEMGFSNEQILKLQDERNSDDEASPDEVVPPAATEKPVTPKPQTPASTRVAERLSKLKEMGCGLVIICASKDWVARGPGYLNVRMKDNTGKWGGCGPARLVECFQNGQYTIPVTETVRKVEKSPKPAPKDKHKDGKGKPEVIVEKVTTVTRQMPMITSRYYAEFVIGAGTPEFELEKWLTRNETDRVSPGTEKRHRKFYKVPVEPGKVTVLSYFWKQNIHFGLDEVMPSSHTNFVQRNADRFKGYISRIIVQYHD